MAHNHEEEIDYESLPAGSSMAINMFAGAMVSSFPSILLALSREERVPLRRSYK